jgi:hypothetical protein
MRPQSLTAARVFGEGREQRGLTLPIEASYSSEDA